MGKYSYQLINSTLLRQDIHLKIINFKCTVQSFVFYIHIYSCNYYHSQNIYFFYPPHSVKNVSSSHSSFFSLINGLFKVYYSTSKYFCQKYSFFWSLCFNFRYKFLVVNLLGMISVFKNLLSFVLCPIIWSILVNILCALQIIVNLLLLDEVSYHYWLITLLKPPAFLLNFSLLISLIIENGKLKTPFIIMNLLFFPVISHVIHVFEYIYTFS